MGNTANNENQPKQVQSGNVVNLYDFFQRCLKYWYVFVISIVLALVVAVWYISSTAPTYMASACLVIKQDRRSGSSGLEAASSSFSNMGSLFAQQTNVYNEIIAFRSPSLMEEVVKRLDLRANYTSKHMLYQKTLYGNTLPVSVSIIDMADTKSLGMTIEYLNENSVELSRMYNLVGGERFDYSEPIVVNFRDTVETPVGKLVVIPNVAVFDMSHSFAPINMTYSTLKGAIGYYSAGLSVALTDRDATAITLSQVDRSSVRASDVLSNLIYVYNQKWIGDRNQIAVSTSNFINDRLVVIEQELGSVDSDISSYKSSNLLLDPMMSGSMYLSQSNQIQSDIMKLNNYLEMAKYIRDYMASSSNTNQLLPANSGIENLSIEQQIAEYNEKQLQRNNLVANSSVSNPIVVDLDAILKSMHDALMSSIDNYIVTLNAQINSLSKTSDENIRNISVNPLQTEHLTNIERQQKVKESLYLYLLQKREENELSQAFTAYNTRILTPPLASSSPVSPMRNRILLIAFVLGLFIPAAVLYALEAMNTKVRGRKDVDTLSVPFVGEIPQINTESDKKWFKFIKLRMPIEEKVPLVVVKHKARDVANEAFRVVRTNLEFICPKGSSYVIQTTSFNVGSGKTFISANLAISLAVKGKKVCAVDMDLRKCSLSAYVSSPKHGITDFLSGKIDDIQQVIFKDAITPGLDVIPAGAIPPNPTELLYSERLGMLIEYLKTKYDFIFLDCPPVEIVADPAIVNEYADHTLFIIRSGLLRRDMLPEIDKYYFDHKFNGMMVLLNGTDSNSHYSYNRYGYGYGYGYYGYGHGKSRNAYGNDAAS